MAQYIDKSTLVAEIEKRLHQLTDAAFDSKIGRNLIEIKDFLNTLKVKEVDLEKEIALVKGDYEQVDVAWNKDFDFIARHFFELGMAVSIKAQKGE